jgi:hypothetical protein
MKAEASRTPDTDIYCHSPNVTLLEISTHDCIQVTHFPHASQRLTRTGH